MRNKATASAIAALAFSAFCFWGTAASGEVFLKAKPVPGTAPYWPPSPPNMVYLDGTVSFAAGGAGTVYQVPANKWFVLTAFDGGGGRSLVENLVGTATVKVGVQLLGLVDGAGSESNGIRPQTEPPLGIVFKPGSEVQVSGPAISGFQFSLAGYLVNDEMFAVRRPWPPHPRDMVTIDSEALPGFVPGDGHSLPPGASLQLFSVPANKFFVVTGVWSRPGTGFSGKGTLAEDMGGVITTKVNSKYMGATYSGTSVPLPLNVRAPLGVTFRPGSNVLLHNPAGTSVFEVYCGLVGYLVDA